MGNEDDERCTVSDAPGLVHHLLLGEYELQDEDPVPTEIGAQVTLLSGAALHEGADINSIAVQFLPSGEFSAGTYSDGNRIRVKLVGGFCRTGRAEVWEEKGYFTPEGGGNKRITKIGEFEKLEDGRFELTLKDMFCRGQDAMYTPPDSRA